MVPVKVELCPAASSAMPNSTPATAVPTMGSSSRCASWMSATSWWPLAWKAAAASTRMAPLTSSASDSETMVSSRDRPTASRRAGSVSETTRVCTIDECRYRLCGITVAPRMPMAK